MGGRVRRFRLLSVVALCYDTISSCVGAVVTCLTGVGADGQCVPTVLDGYSYLRTAVIKSMECYCCMEILGTVGVGASAPLGPLLGLVPVPGVVSIVFLFRGLRVS